MKVDISLIQTKLWINNEPYHLVEIDSVRDMVQRVVYIFIKDGRSGTIYRNDKSILYKYHDQMTPSKQHHVEEPIHYDHLLSVRCRNGEDYGSLIRVRALELEVRKFYGLR